MHNIIELTDYLSLSLISFIIETTLELGNLSLVHHHDDHQHHPHDLCHTRHARTNHLFLFLKKHQQLLRHTNQASASRAAIVLKLNHPALT